MPAVTVLGVQGAVITLPFTSEEQYVLAATLAGSINAAIRAGTLTPVNALPFVAPPLLPGQIGELVIQSSGTELMSAGYKAVISTAKATNILGVGETNQSVVASGSVDFVTGGGSGTVIAGGGGSQIIATAAPGAGWLISTGGGGNTIDALSGDETISGGVGSNSILLGTGNNLVIVDGKDTVTAGSGADTIAMDVGGKALVYGGSGSLAFYGEFGGANTVVGGSGSETIFGGDGPETVVAGTGSATLVGGMGSELLQIVHGTAGGSELLLNFTGADSVSLSGYTPGEAQNDLAHAVVSNGSTVITLSDNTKITFAGITNPSSIHFG